ncbi:MAG TPA: hypothetical protein VG106_07425, partial [Vicinamibacterales bacterium]|nr:hypothetical protein [Vicinamibacterales bacterium]
MAQRSPKAPGTLAWTALGLLETAASAVELRHRFESDGAKVADTRAAELLDELVGLGLARITEANGSPRYIRTPLGEQLAASSFGERHDLR